MSSIPPVKLTLFGGQKHRSNYLLTAKGKMKAEELSLSGPRGQVVSALDNSETPNTISEIASVAGMSPGKVGEIKTGVEVGSINKEDSSKC